MASARAQAIRQQKANSHDSTASRSSIGILLSIMLLPTTALAPLTARDAAAASCERSDCRMRHRCDWRFSSAAGCCRVRAHSSGSLSSSSRLLEWQAPLSRSSSGSLFPSLLSSPSSLRLPMMLALLPKTSWAQAEEALFWPRPRGAGTAAPAREAAAAAAQIGVHCPAAARVPRAFEPRAPRPPSPLRAPPYTPDTRPAGSRHKFAHARTQKFVKPLFVGPLLW